VGQLHAVARREDAVRRGGHPLVHHDPTGGADRQASLLGQPVVRPLVGAHHHDVGRQLAFGGADRAHLPLAHERLDAGVEVGLHAELGPRLLDRLHDVGVGDLGQRPWVGVDHVRLDAPVGEGGDHLQPEG
jgi:hypothetical protein